MESLLAKGFNIVWFYERRMTREARAILGIKNSVILSAPKNSNLGLSSE